MGPSPEGVIVYTPGGTMITTIARRDRPSMSGGDLLGGPSEEIVRMATTFVAYAGTYVVDAGDVIHEVEMSLFPDWVGTRQRRHAALSADGATLTLSSDWMVVRGRRGRQHLVWRRVRD